MTTNIGPLSISIDPTVLANSDSYMHKWSSGLYRYAMPITHAAFRKRLEEAGLDPDICPKVRRPDTLLTDVCHSSEVCEGGKFSRYLRPTKDEHGNDIAKRARRTRKNVDRGIAVVQDDGTGTSGTMVVETKIKIVSYESSTWNRKVTVTREGEKHNIYFASSGDGPTIDKIVAEFVRRADDLEPSDIHDWAKKFLISHGGGLKGSGGVIWIPPYLVPTAKLIAKVIENQTPIMDIDAAGNMTQRRNLDGQLCWEQDGIASVELNAVVPDQVAVANIVAAFLRQTEEQCEEIDQAANLVYSGDEKAPGKRALKKRAEELGDQIALIEAYEKTLGLHLMGARAKIAEAQRVLGAVVLAADIADK